MCLSSLFPRLFRLALHKDVLVSNVLSSFSSGLSCNFNFSRELSDREVYMLASLTSKLKEVFISDSFPDQRVWILEPLGKFSSKFLFMSIAYKDNFNPKSLFPIKKIWNPPIPSRVKVFLWTAALNRINTMDMLQR